MHFSLRQSKLSRDRKSSFTTALLISLCGFALESHAFLHKSFTNEMLSFFYLMRGENRGPNLESTTTYQ